MPEKDSSLLVLDFVVGKRGLGDRIPVDEIVAPINQSIVVHFFETRADGLVALFIHRETKAGPVAGAAEFFDLAKICFSLFLFPAPNALRNSSRSKSFRRLPVLAYRFLSTTVWVAMPAWSVPGIQSASKPVHPFPANQDVLQRIDQSVAHMENAGYIRRGDDDAEGCFFDCGSALKKPPSSQKEYHFSSTSFGSYEA